MLLFLIILSILFTGFVLLLGSSSTKEIADLVELSPRTVEAIRDKLKVKTGAKSLAGLVMYAVKSGIIENRPIVN
jgi:DNA-binding CsgD family transcriptional regulator